MITSHATVNACRIRLRTLRPLAQPDGYYRDVAEFCRQTRLQSAATDGEREIARRAEEVRRRRRLFDYWFPDTAHPSNVELGVHLRYMKENAKPELHQMTYTLDGSEGHFTVLWNRVLRTPPPR